VIQNAELGLAKVRYESGDKKAALLLFAQISARYPKTEAALEALLWMGQHAMSGGLYNRAVEHFQQALDDFPKHERRGLICFELGRAYQAQGLADKAIEQYRQVTGEDLVTKARLAIADIFAQDMDPAKAIDTYRNIIVTSPEYKREALAKIAQVYRRSQDFVKERAAYEEALLSPSASSQIPSAELQFMIGDSFEVAGDQLKAVEAYFKVPYVYAKYPFWVVKAYLRIAKIYENQEDWENALMAYNKVVAMNVDESKFAVEQVARVQEYSKKISH
jgi:lipopolysaccharide biosynthesis regulator YciM